MKYFFSPSTKAFYPEEFIPDYKNANTLPSDIVEVSQSDFKKFSLTPPPEGMSRQYENGTLTWKQNEINLDVLKAAELGWIEVELARARDELEKVQDSDPKARGSVSEWRDYRRMLRAWPEKEDFPSLEARPVAPDI